MKKFFFAALLVAAVAIMSLPPGYAAAGSYDSGDAPDQVLVKFQGGMSDAVKNSVHQKLGGQVVGTIAEADVQVVKSRGRVDDDVKAYRADPAVVFAEPDHRVRTDLIPSDYYFFQQWDMGKIQAPNAWDVTRGSSGIRIAIVDTGIDADHPDLKSKIVASRNFTTSYTTDDRFGHGTHVAGTAAAVTNNGSGVSGVGYNSTLINAKALSDNGSGNISWIANAIVWSANIGARVINLSLGSPNASETLRSAVDYAWNRGAIVVAAAGNSNTSAPSYPAYYSNVVAVGATDSGDRKASYSNYGSWVDVAAPGTGIFSTLPNHQAQMSTRNYGSLSGTSMAAPHVAGLAALIFARNPGWTNSNVRAKVLGSVNPTSGFTTALGRVNAWTAVR